KNTGTSSSRPRLERVHSYAPWEWTIGVTIAQDEVFAAAAAVDGVASSFWRAVFWIAGLSLLLSASVWSLVGRRCSQTVARLGGGRRSAAANLAAAQEAAESAERQTASLLALQADAEQEAETALDEIAVAAEESRATSRQLSEHADAVQ